MAVRVNRNTGPKQKDTQRRNHGDDINHPISGF